MGANSREATETNGYLYQPKPKPNLNVKDLLPKVGDYIGHIKGRDFREERQYSHRKGMEVRFSLFDVKLT